MAGERQKWNVENESLYNQDYYADYLKRADNQSLIKNMRDETKKQNVVDQNVAAVTGASPEAINAGKERRNRAMSNVYSNIAARGAEFQDRAKGRYMARKQALQGMEYDVEAQKAQSANNLMYNGIAGLATTDWGSILKSGASPGKIDIKTIEDKYTTPNIK